MHYEKFPDGTVKCIEDEIPFELPEGWEWTRLQAICEPITDGTHKTPTYSDEGFIFLSSKNVTSGHIDWDNIMYIPESLHNELYARLAPQKNDILLAKNGIPVFCFIFCGTSFEFVLLSYRFLLSGHLQIRLSSIDR